MSARAEMKLSGAPREPIRIEAAVYLPPTFMHEELYVVIGDTGILFDRDQIDNLPKEHRDET